MFLALQAGSRRAGAETKKAPRREKKLQVSFARSMPTYMYAYARRCRANTFTPLLGHHLLATRCSPIRGRAAG